MSRGHWQRAVQDRVCHAVDFEQIVAQAFGIMKLGAEAIDDIDGGQQARRVVARFEPLERGSIDVAEIRAGRGRACSHGLDV
ncbi:protein of unknown function (plasmid) [Paraburkholderia kururiensis]